MGESTGYVALGSNLGDREASLRAGLRGMAAEGLAVEAWSSVWETEPVDSPVPLWFLNMVARIRTARGPFEVLDLLQEIERRVGGVRTARRNAPRVLDLDLLLLGEHRIDEPRLQLPHPRMWERRFVLEPLAELAPELCDPRTGRSVLETRDALGDRFEVHRLGVLAAPLGRPV
jgi:2-amino-4-hydroxy-6-hydroxymethyldihydropteridine diphosphokinase